MRRLNTLHNRLFLLILSCMMALILVFGMIYYQRLTRIIHNQTGEMAEKNISQTVDLFDLMLKGYDSITKSLNSNYEMLRLIKERDNTGEAAVKVINERTITNNIGALYFSRDDIIAINVITNGGIIYNYERRFAGVVDASFADKDWYRELKESTGEMVWLGLYQGSMLNAMQEDPVFVFGRQLYDLTDHRSVGIVVFETDPKAILSALTNASLSPNSKVYILDNANRIIASTDREAAKALSLDEALGTPPPVLDIAAASVDHLAVSAKPKLADWTVLSLTPKADINAQISKTRQYLFVVIGALIMLSTIIATVISRTIASPLKLLIREMRQVEMGHFRGSLNVRSFEEINSLVASFNRMVNRMDELIERITLASVSEKNAELAALQSQVNPHFLYNTLDMIYWMLDERGNDKLGRVILALSHMFRYSSDWEEASKTTLRHELEQMRHYMTIIENRLAGRVRTDIEIEEKWLDTVIPKMTLQPIIENAVKAGLEPLNNRTGIIRVYTESDEEEFHLIIADNGIGMDEETLGRLRESLEDGANAIRQAGPGRGEGRYGSVFGSGAGRESGRPADQPGPGRRGIGLPNVHRRLALHFGDVYGLRIHSEPGRGTTVTIAMPLPAAANKGEDYGIAYRRR